MSSLYAVAPSTVMFDRKLSPNIIYTYLVVSMNLGFTGMTYKTISQLVSSMTDVKEATIRSHIKTLIERGHLVHVKKDHGEFLSLPDVLVKHSDSLPKPKAEVVNEDASEEMKKFTEEWNRLYGTRSKPNTASLRALLTPRLKDYSLDEIIEAARCRHARLSKSEWHQKEENYHHFLSYKKFLRDNDEIAKFANAKPKKVETEKIQSFKFL